MRVFRKVSPLQRPLLRDHLLRLSEEERSLRFGGVASDALVAGHAGRLDFQLCGIIGFFDDGDIRGAVELHFDKAYLPRRAELAVTVEGAWQDRGIGTELIRRALISARNRGVRHLAMLCLVDNYRMRRIAGKLAADLRASEGDLEAEITLPLPNLLSLWEEAATDGIGLLGGWVDRFNRPWTKASQFPSASAASFLSAPPRASMEERSRS
jgi:GNAT superfamily N-acetyltransferase